MQLWVVRAPVAKKSLVGLWRGGCLVLLLLWNIRVKIWQYISLKKMLFRHSFDVWGYSIPRKDLRIEITVLVQTNILQLNLLLSPEYFSHHKPIANIKLNLFKVRSTGYWKRQFSKRLLKIKIFFPLLREEWL